MKACMIDLNPEVLRQLLRLPKGVCITGVDQPADRIGVLRVRVEGMGWDCPEGSLLPLTQPVIITSYPLSLSVPVVSVDWGCPLPGEQE